LSASDYASPSLQNPVRDFLLGALISTPRISAFLYDSAVILLYTTITAETHQRPLRYAEQISKVGHYHFSLGAFEEYRVAGWVGLEEGLED
jgi:hypothetical protein